MINNHEDTKHKASAWELGTGIYGEDRKKREYNITGIMDEYVKRSPSYKELYKKSSGEKYCQVGYEVTLINGRKLLLKTIRIDKTHKVKINSHLREYHILKNVQGINKYIVKLLDMRYTVGEPNNTLIFEMLFDNNSEPLTKAYYEEHKKYRECIELAYRLICILSDLESVGVSHMNIKPESIRLDNNKQLMLTNFSSAISFFYNPEELRVPLGQSIEKFSGYSRFYAPPEIYQLSKGQDCSTILAPQLFDCFSFGLTFYMWVNWDNGKNIDMIPRSESEGHSKLIRDLRKDLTKYKLNNFESIFLSCMSIKRRDRPTFAALRTNLDNYIQENAKKWILPKERFDASSLNKQIQEHKTEKEYEAMIWKLKKLLSLSGGSTDSSWMDLITVYFKTGRYDDCIKDYQNKFATLNLDNEIHFRAALIAFKAYLFQDNLNNAQNILSKAWKEEFKNSVEYLRAQGNINEAKNDYETALNYYKKALGITKPCNKDYNGINRDIIRALLKLGYITEARNHLPDNKNWKTLILYGKIEQIRRNYLQALEYYEVAEYNFKMVFGEDHPRLVDILILKAEAQEKIENLSAAFKSVSDAELIANKRYNIKCNDIKTLIGNIYLNSGEYVKAKDHADRIQKGDKILPEVNLLQSECYKSLGQYQSAINTLTELDNNQNNILNYNNVLSARIRIALGEAYMAIGQIGEGLVSLNKVERWCYRIGNDANMYLCMVYNAAINGCLLKNNYALALKILERLRKLKEGQGIAEIAIGKLYNTFGFPELSYVYFVKALELHGNLLWSKRQKVELIKMIGDNLKDCKKYKDAIAQYDKALNLLKCDKLILGGELYNSKGECERLNNNANIALKCHEKAHSIYADLANEERKTLTIICITEAFLKLGNYEAALKSLKKVIEKLNNKRLLGRVYSNMGLIYYRQDDIPKAIESYEKAVKELENPILSVKEEYAVALSNLGKCLYLNKEHVKATETLTKSLEYTSIDSTIKDICDTLNKVNENNKSWTAVDSSKYHKVKERNINLIYGYILAAAHKIEIEPKTAISYLMSSESVIREHKILDKGLLRQVYQYFIYGYEKSGDQAKVEEYKEKLQALNN